MLTAGAAVVDISPRAPMALFGYPHVERILTGIHDPLLASALCLRNGNESVLLIALDLLFLDPPTARELRRRAAAAAGVPEAGVFISCTHTHSGPVTLRMLAWSADPAVPAPDVGYLEQMKVQVESAARAAAAKLRPVEIAWTSADARGVGGNRHAVDGATDPDAGVLSVRCANTHAPLAVAVVYGMHPTVMHEDSTLVSSDFPHYTRQHLKEALGPELTVLYFTGPEGNQSPRRSVTAQTFAEAERLGRTLGASIARSVAAIPAGQYRADGVIRGTLERVTLPARRIPPVAEAERRVQEWRDEMRRLQQTGASKADVRTAECAVFGAESTLGLARAGQGGELERILALYNPTEVQVVRIGDFRLPGLPGELFVEYGLELKRRAPAGTFPVCLVNGELQGYVVTAEAAAANGYEAANSVFAPESGAVLVETALRMLKAQGGGSWG